MGKVISIRNLGVYVYNEQGSPHHLPHGHIHRGKQRLASVFLLSLELFNEVERLPAWLREALQRTRRPSWPSGRG